MFTGEAGGEGYDDRTGEVTKGGSVTLEGEYAGGTEDWANEAGAGVKLMGN